MERLTEKNPTWIDDEFWVSAKEPDDELIDAVYLKLKEYEDAEEQGLIVRCNPQPLTVEQLKKMNGKPVYTVTGIHLPCENDCWWGVLHVIPDAYMMHFYGIGRIRSVDIGEYGKTWLAYDHEPKEVIDEV